MLFIMCVNLFINHAYICPQEYRKILRYLYSSTVNLFNNTFFLISLFSFTKFSYILEKIQKSLTYLDPNYSIYNFDTLLSILKKG